MYGQGVVWKLLPNGVAVYEHQAASDHVHVVITEKTVKVQDCGRHERTGCSHLSSVLARPSQDPVSDHGYDLLLLRSHDQLVISTRDLSQCLIFALGRLYEPLDSLRTKQLSPKQRIMLS